MGDWTEEEIRRYLKRAHTLQTNGMDEQDAEHLAQQLLYRDRPDSGDDRRLCIECKRLRNKRCGVGLPAVWTVLQRCDRFLSKH